MKLNARCARWLGLIVWGLTGSDAALAADESVYQIVYGAKLDPATQHAEVRIAVRQSRALLRHVRFDAPRDRYLNVHGQGDVVVAKDHIDWSPPPDGGVLHFDFAIDHARDGGGQDARITEKWALLKLDRLFPPAKVRVLKGARSDATLRLTAPVGWSIETPYGPAEGHMHAVDDPRTRFDRPKGWLLAGQLAIRRDIVADRRVAVGSPKDSGFRSNDMLAFVRWTLPSLVQIFPRFPQRLLIVSGPDGMWRGGLSGAGSIYLHADRPLISQNGTSTPLHEMVHVASGLHGTGGADWIVEGIAEYYSLDVLRRSNTISEQRYQASFATLAKWSEGRKCIATDRSEGTQTAYAVGVMRALDREIRAATHDGKSLDDLARALSEAHAQVTNAGFRAAAVKLIGAAPKVLAGCPQ
jgi:hypothetical protein